MRPWGPHTCHSAWVWYPFPAWPSSMLRVEAWTPFHPLTVILQFFLPIRPQQLMIINFNLKFPPSPIIEFSAIWSLRLCQSVWEFWFFGTRVSFILVGVWATMFSNKLTSCKVIDHFLKWAIFRLAWTVHILWAALNTQRTRDSWPQSTQYPCSDFHSNPIPAKFPQDFIWSWSGCHRGFQWVPYTWQYPTWWICQIGLVTNH